jgi:hypothetical protein
MKSRIRKLKMFKALLEVLMAEKTRITELRDVAPSSLLDGYKRFVGKYCLCRCVRT